MWTKFLSFFGAFPEGPFRYFFTRQKFSNKIYAGKNLFLVTLILTTVIFLFLKQSQVVKTNDAEVRVKSNSQVILGTGNTYQKKSSQKVLAATTAPHSISGTVFIDKNYMLDNRHFLLK